MRTTNNMSVTTSAVPTPQGGSLSGHLVDVFNALGDAESIVSDVVDRLGLGGPKDVVASQVSSSVLGKMNDVSMRVQNLVNALVLINGAI